MNYLEEPKQFKQDYGICLYECGKGPSFDLEVKYWDSTWGEHNFVDLNALEVYKHLKEYFKGTEYE